MDCPACGGPLKRTFRTAGSANRTANRKVGGRGIHTQRKCLNCRETFDKEDLL